MDITHSEEVEAHLDALITKRDRQRRETEGERREHEMYEESCRAYNAAQERERRAEWLEYRRAAAVRARRTLGALVREHEATVARLERLEETA